MCILSLKHQYIFGSTNIFVIELLHCVHGQAPVVLPCQRHYIRANIHIETHYALADYASEFFFAG
jgi:hypothetical protein